ncbi:unnamed protein product [Protopolystoma xenopodis]|uniref:Uncharacterized protein n=1 Tax=Protopolystoma xenopodis TaxID=117903 RepID=A0A448WAN0_9PLAT|nr:unnamed protein product [Protopolystoma xenopodis]
MFWTELASPKKRYSPRPHSTLVDEDSLWLNPNLGNRRQSSPIHLEGMSTSVSNTNHSTSTILAAATALSRFGQSTSKYEINPRLKQGCQDDSRIGLSSSSIMAVNDYHGNYDNSNKGISMTEAASIHNSKHSQSHRTKKATSTSDTSGNSLSIISVPFMCD